LKGLVKERGEKKGKVVSFCSRVSFPPASEDTYLRSEDADRGGRREGKALRGWLRPPGVLNQKRVERRRSSFVANC